MPRLGPVTTTHRQVLVDGIWIGDWCLLIAVTEKLEVLAWQWSAGETTAAWSALFERIPAPEVVVCDGGSGIASAVRKTRPTTKVQRCIFHVQMNIRRHLTMNPRSDAARRLRKLSLQLTDVREPQDAIQWQLKLEAWWQAYGHLTKVRTYDGRKSWFTHDPLRKAWNLLFRLSRDGTLFTYVEHSNARTTSPLEGGINSGIRAVLRSHRGMPEAHAKRAAEWFLTLHEIPIDRAHELITAAPTESETPIDLPARTQAVEAPEISLYDTSLSAEEGLWNRSGWAGRS
ncbi:MAG: family transposase [Glaciihabitans sp.]|nr:family transposase [Glaciihabitans sp.]